MGIKVIVAQEVEYAVDDEGRHLLLQGGPGLKGLALGLGESDDHLAQGLRREADVREGDLRLLRGFVRALEVAAVKGEKARTSVTSSSPR